MSNYVCSDLHGCGDLWKQIKEFLKPEDKLYFLGDAADRGPDGWNILKEILKDERIIYILGNHDVMLYDRIKNPDNYEIVSLHVMNGGNPTWKLAGNDPEAIDVAAWLNDCPLYTIYENANGLKIFMSHSGSTNINNYEDLIWDRAEYISSENYSDYDVIVHGHTTIPHLIRDLNQIRTFYSFGEKDLQPMPDWNGGAYWYHGNRCDIDCCTIITKQTVLLDLDTFEEHLFKN